MDTILTKITVSNTLTFLFVGLCLVFPMGLLSLTVGPNRWVAQLSELYKWSDTTQSSLQKVAIVIFLILVLWATIKVTQYLDNKFNYNRKQKRIVWGILSVGLLVSVYIFSFQPEVLTAINVTDSVDKSDTAEYHFGPYPDADKLQQLKAENYDGVISLLHPLVVPAEPILMDKEKANAAKAEIKLISVPMLPWISKNDSSVVAIRKMARELKGKYYVHCYLGKDRANVFKNIIRKETGHTVKGVANSERSLELQQKFERGTIYKLENEVYLTPCPTDEEMLAFILNGKVNSVVSLLNPEEEGDAKILGTEKLLMNRYNQFYANHPIHRKMSDEEILQKIKTIKTYRKPMVIHAFFTDNSTAKRFRELYAKDMTP
ncbi:MAG: hypothetical protein RLZZ500_2429 [Bacteroidota bacterium]|jgi:uncharacterized membrane protein YidH (DUF202 family)